MRRPCSGFPARPARRAAAEVVPPLDLGYVGAGLAQPVARPIPADRLPPEYASLLAHDADMTPTLERHHDDRLLVRALATWMRRGVYGRRVLLLLAGAGRPAAMGAIRIRLDVLPPRVRARVLKGDVPLGRILREGRLDYRSRPRAFFEVTPNSEMMGVFWMREPRMLYGRRTEATLGGARFGDIVEILPAL